MNFRYCPAVCPVQYNNVHPWGTQTNQMVRLGVSLALCLDVISGIEQLRLIAMLASTRRGWGGLYR